MCYLCAEHGDGRKWFENVKNYSKRMAEDARTRAYLYEKFFPHTEVVFSGQRPGSLGQILGEFLTPQYPQKRREVEMRVTSYHQGQVVSKEEAKDVMKLASPISLGGCVCRRLFRAKQYDDDGAYCVFFGVLLDYLKDWPDFIERCEVISQDRALDLLDENYQKGYVQSVWTFGTPYIGAMCTCSYPTCMPIQLRRDYDLAMMLKGHQVAKVDMGRCTGCGNCVPLCQFGALSLDPAIGKAILNMKKCFGCGVCRKGCSKMAIGMRARGEIPALRELW